eukprot:242427_1
MANKESLIHSGWMYKKGKIAKNWKQRYFELHNDGLLYYYTDEKKKTLKGTANLFIIIAINIVDNKNFEIITPHRVWCFECKFKSETEHWIDYIKNLKCSVLYHDKNKKNNDDKLNISENMNILKLITEIGDKQGERIKYSDNITIIKSNKEEMFEFVLTNLCLYLLKPNEQKCKKQIMYANIKNEGIDVISSDCFKLKGVTYKTDHESLKVIMEILSMYHLNING